MFFFLLKLDSVKFSTEICRNRLNALVQREIILILRIYDTVAIIKPNCVHIWLYVVHLH